MEKLSEKLKKRETALSIEEVKEIIPEIEYLEDSLKVEKKEVERLKDEFKKSLKEQVEKYNNIKPEEEKKEPELTYRTGPTSVEISKGEEKISVDYRISMKVAGKVHSYVFSAVSEEEPEKGKGKTVKEHKLGEETIFVIYSK